jgi:hypothetical protein
MFQRSKIMLHSTTQLCSCVLLSQQIYVIMHQPHSVILVLCQSVRYVNSIYYYVQNDKTLVPNLKASNISLYDVASLSNALSLSTAVLSEVINLSNLSGLIAMRPPSVYNIILQCPNIALCSVSRFTGSPCFSMANQ